MYKLKTKVLPEDVNKFRATPTDHLKESFYRKQNYLILHAKLLKQSAKKATKQAQHNIRNFFNFFQPQKRRQVLVSNENTTDRELPGKENINPDSVNPR